MNLPLSWLKDFVKITVEPIQLAKDLADIGFEVEGIEDCSANLSSVVIGKIISINPHENADKLVVCTVDVGADDKLSIVTGANNIKLADLVPVALDGAVLPCGKTISSGELRGVLSQGMLCSASELGITSDLYDGEVEKGIMILTKTKPKIGTDIKKLFGLDDFVLNVAIPANRPDCNSIYGLAREIATMYHKPLLPLDLGYTTSKTETVSAVSVTIDNKEFCTAYFGQIVKQVIVEPSIDKIRQRLFKVGIKPINNIVDITNYVLAEVGQPMHGFDAKWAKDGIIVRKANDKERIVALDNKEYELTVDTQVIASHRSALAVAGVIGGKETAINNDTHEVFFECASFNRADIRKTARRLGIRTDSSTRYEKGVSMGLQMIGMSRALHLIDKYKLGLIAAKQSQVGTISIKPRVVEFDIGNINKFLGVEIPLKSVESILAGLDLKLKKSSSQATPNKYIATIPMHREDLQNEADIAEELIRFYGYDKLSTTLLDNYKLPIGTQGQSTKNGNYIRQIMIGYGYHEIITYSFVPDIVDKLLINQHIDEYRAIPILNPLSIDYGYMRTLLLGSALHSIAHNNAQKNNNYGLFELGRAYIKKRDSDKVVELDKLCIVGVGERADFYEIKHIVCTLLDRFFIKYNLTNSREYAFINEYCGTSVLVLDKSIGFIGQVHPLVLESFDINKKVVVAEIDLGCLINARLPLVKVQPIPKYPVVTRDIALIVDIDTQASSIINCIKSADDIIKSVNIFDIYTGEQVPTSKKSVALSIEMYANYTMIDTQIHDIIVKVLDKLSTDNIATLRQ